MNTAVFDFTGNNALRRGATYRLTFNFKGSNGLPINFTGCSAIARFKKSLNASTAYSLSVSIGEPPTGGSISLVIPANVTAPLATGKYVWDALITMSNGDLWRALEGELHLVGGVS